MSINQIGLHPSVVSQAYNRALVFDQMKKKEDAPAGPEAIAPDKSDAVEVQYLEGPPREKQKPNTVPFKPGFMFEYGQGTDKGPVAVAITEKEKVNVELKEDADSDSRKKTIRSLVHLALKKIDRDGFNGMLEQGKLSNDKVRSELALMGLKPEIPFGLGTDSFYFNARERLSAYRPVDIKG